MSEKCRVVKGLGGEWMEVCQQPKNEGEKVAEKKKEAEPPKDQEKGVSSFVMKDNRFHSII
ncbi:MAG: hypothetical protein WC551_13160 [Patescibacteria group bacterium]